MLAVALTYYWSFYNFAVTGIDDANIYFVYADNLSNGFGFVYNPGGERVEGFSSILWTLIATGAFYLSDLLSIPPESLLLILNISLTTLIATASLALLNQFIPATNPKWLIPAPFLLLLLTAPNFVFWNTISLMETALWCALLTLSTVVVLQPEINFSTTSKLLTGLIVLQLFTRPESYLWVFVFASIFFVRQLQTSDIRSAFRVIWLPLVAIGGTIGLITTFRFSYFGFPFPNTYYAKVSSSILWNIQEGTLYLVDFLSSNPIVTLAVIAAFAGTFQVIPSIFSKEFGRNPFDFLPVLALIGLCIPLLIGGDHFAGFRFYQPLFPILLLSMFYWLIPILQKFENWTQISGVLLGSIILGIPLVATPFTSFDLYRTIYSVVIFLFAYIVFRVLPQFKTSREWFGVVGNFLSRVNYFGLTIIGLIAILFWQQIEFSKAHSDLAYDLFLAVNGQRTGNFIESFFADFDQLPTIGAIAAGGIKYGYSGEIVDLLGLNHVQMGHSEGDRQGLKNHAAFNEAVFYELSPDLVTPLRLNQADDYQSNPPFYERPVDRELLKNIHDEPSFLADYQFAVVASSDEETEHVLAAWFRKDFLKKLEEDSSFKVESFEYQPQMDG